MLIDGENGFPYYGTFLQFVNFYENNNIPTCGVNVTIQGMNFYYNSLFLDRLPQKEVNFIVIHEIFHFLFDHPKRTVSGNYEHRLANVAQDMIINHIIVQDISHLNKTDEEKKKLFKFVEIPKNEEGKNLPLFLPKEYKGLLIFEELYEWLREEREKRKKEKRKQEALKMPIVGKLKPEGDGGNNQEKGEEESDEQSDGGNNSDKQDSSDNKGNSKDKGDNQKNDSNSSDGSGGEESGYGPYGKFPSDLQRHKGKNIDTYSLDHIFDNMEETNGEYLDTHMEDEVSEDIKDLIVKNVHEKLKSRGLLEGNGIDNTLKKLKKPRKDYLSHIKRAISTEIFGNVKQKTITRLNRRGITGLKGNKKVKSKIVVVLDTSGSMSGTFEKVLSYIYRTDIEIVLIEIDTRVRSVEKIKYKKQLETIEIKGLGGTILQPAIDLILESYNNLNTLILSDGYCEELDLRGIKGNVLVLTTGKEITFHNCGRNKVKQVIIEKTK